MRDASAGKPEGEESWKEVGKSDGPKCFFSMGGLTKGPKYQFRARSVNKDGPPVGFISEPCPPTPILTPKPRKCRLNFFNLFTCYYFQNIHRFHFGRSLKSQYFIFLQVLQLLTEIKYTRTKYGVG